MSTIAELERKIQVIFAIFKRFGNIHAFNQYHPGDRQARSLGYIRLRDFEIFRGRAIGVNQ